MAIYRCNSCGATTDTEATARALRDSLGYGPGTEIALTDPQKCDVCGSTDIAQVTAEQPHAPTRAENPRAETPRVCTKCGAESSDASLFCRGCGAFDRRQSQNWLLMIGTLMFMGVWAWASLVDGWGTHRPQWLCAAFPILFGVVILAYLVQAARDSARALRNAGRGRGLTVAGTTAQVERDASDGPHTTLGDRPGRTRGEEASVPSEEFLRLDAQKMTWIGWDRDQLVRTFGQPQVVNGGGADERLGFDVSGCTVSVHLIDGVVTSAEVFAPWPK
jgi:hypothetical protein